MLPYVEHKTDLYFEAHITIEPVFGEELERLKEVTKQFNFRVADLLMKKRQSDSPQRSMYDTFCTTRSQEFVDIEDRTHSCVEALREAGFNVWRAKIENTLYDERFICRGGGTG